MLLIPKIIVKCRAGFMDICSIKRIGLVVECTKSYLNLLSYDKYLKPNKQTNKQKTKKQYSSQGHISIHNENECCTKKKVHCTKLLHKNSGAKSYQHLYIILEHLEEKQGKQSLHKQGVDIKKLSN